MTKFPFEFVSRNGIRFFSYSVDLSTGITAEVPQNRSGEFHLLQAAMELGIHLATEVAPPIKNFDLDKGLKIAAIQHVPAI